MTVERAVFPRLNRSLGHFALPMNVRFFFGTEMESFLSFWFVLDSFDKSDVTWAVYGSVSCAAATRHVTTRPQDHCYELKDVCSCNIVDVLMRYIPAPMFLW